MFLISSGSEFHKIGAETERKKKALAPYVLRLCFGTSKYYTHDVGHNHLLASDLLTCPMFQLQKNCCLTLCNFRIPVEVVCPI